MEPKQPNSPTPRPTSPPVMDIKIPSKASEPVRAAPPETGGPAPESAELKKDDKKASKLPKPPKAHGNGVSLAIFATIVIILGLGAMIVYAYLRTNGLSSL